MPSNPQLLETDLSRLRKPLTKNLSFQSMIKLVMWTGIHFNPKTKSIQLSWKLLQLNKSLLLWLIWTGDEGMMMDNQPKNKAVLNYSYLKQRERIKKLMFWRVNQNLFPSRNINQTSSKIKNLIMNISNLNFKWQKQTKNQHSLNFKQKNQHLC